MSDIDEDGLSRRKTLARIAALSICAYAAPALTTLSMAQAGSGSGGGSGSSGDSGGSSGSSSPSSSSDSSSDSNSGGSSSGSSCSGPEDDDAGCSGTSP